MIQPPSQAASARAGRPVSLVSGTASVSARTEAGRPYPDFDPGRSLRKMMISLNPIEARLLESAVQAFIAERPEVHGLESLLEQLAGNRLEAVYGRAEMRCAVESL